MRVRLQVGFLNPNSNGDMQQYYMAALSAEPSRARPQKHTLHTLHTRALRTRSAHERDAHARSTPATIIAHLLLPCLAMHASMSLDPGPTTRPTD